jgi:hypothetical protein
MQSSEVSVIYHHGSGSHRYNEALSFLVPLTALVVTCERSGSTKLHRSENTRLKNTICSIFQRA